MLSFWILLFLLFCNNNCFDHCVCCDDSRNNNCDRNRDRDCDRERDRDRARDCDRNENRRENNRRDRNDDCDCRRDTEERMSFGISGPGPNDCGCGNDFVQPRGFFTGQNTCGCENKSE